MEVLQIILTVLSVIFGLIYCYQLLFMIIGAFFKPKKYPEAKTNHTFAILISARNEEKVIGNLIESIKSQNYPQENLKIFVCADNCTDKTAEICKNLGATVYERFNQNQIGKGYALDFMFKHIAADFPNYEPDAFFVFDADNILSKNYIHEMNKALDAGAKICTSYRNSKNFATNWLSAGASLAFMRECRLLHRPKQILKLSTHVSGTGFFVSKDVLTFKDGWKYTTICEDTEFSTSAVLKGYKVAYNEDAVFYDEQPTKFKQTWKQRTRWSKGTMICFSKLHLSLFASFFKTFNFNFYDYYFGRLFPISIYYAFTTIASAILSLITFILSSINGTVSNVFSMFIPVLLPLVTTYIAFFADALLATILEWKRIKAPAGKKIKYIFTAPIFNFLFSIPTVIYALFKKVKWEPIEHTQVISQEQLEK